MSSPRLRFRIAAGVVVSSAILGIAIPLSANAAQPTPGSKSNGRWATTTTTVANNPGGSTTTTIAPTTTTLAPTTTTAAPPTTTTTVAPVDPAMILKADVTAGQVISLRLGGDGNVAIDWGSTNTSSCATSYVKTGTTNMIDSTYVNCTYNAAGIYTIRLTGSLQGFHGATWVSDRDLNNPKGLTEMSSFGSLGLVTISHAFAESFSSAVGTWGGLVTKVPTTLPATVTDLDSLFLDNHAFTGDLSGWNTSNVTRMTSTFGYATGFNGNISTWNVSNVTDMTGMFEAARSFNGNISAWNPAKVTSMNAMFYDTPMFNQNIGNWNTSSVTDMDGMFAAPNGSVFNQDLSRWNIAKVQYYSGFSCGATAWTLPKPAFAGPTC